MEQHLSRAFGVYGGCVAKYPKTFLVVPILLTVSLAIVAYARYKFVYNFIDLFVPAEAPSRTEQKKLEAFEAGGDDSNDTILIVNMFFQTRNHSNIVQREYTDFILDTYDGIMENVTFTDSIVPEHEESTNMNEFRDKYADEFLIEDNSPLIDTITEVIYTSSTSSFLELSYPKGTYVGKILMMVPSFHGPIYDDESTADQTTKFSIIRLVMKLKYPSVHDGWNRTIDAFDSGLEDFLDAMALQQPELQIMKQTEGVLNSLMRNDLRTSLPFFGASILMMILLVCASGLCFSNITYRFVVPLAGIIVVLLSLISAFGLLLLFGGFATGVMVTALFLMLGTGIDNTFIMLGSWDRAGAKTKVLSQRLQHMFAEAGPAVSVAAFTDFVSFGIGCRSTTPAIWNFCLYTTLSMIFCYFYHLTFVAALFYLSETRRKDAVHSANGANVAEATTTHANGTSNGSVKAKGLISKVKSFNWDTMPAHYSSFLRNPYIRAVTVVVLFLQLFLSMYGMSKAKFSIEVDKLIPDGSIMQEYFRMADREIFAENIFATILVETVPDFANLTQLNRFMAIVDDMESLQFSSGSDDTLLWLRDYIEYIQNFRHKHFYDRFAGWIRSADISYLRQLRFHNDQRDDGYIPLFLDSPIIAPASQLKSFSFQVSYSGLQAWSDKIWTINTLRKFTAQAPEWGMSVFWEGGLKVDMLQSVIESTRQLLGQALLVIAVISALLIPSLLATYLVIFSVLGINIGCIAYLSALSDLDQLSLVLMLMSIGLAINFTLHSAFKLYVYSKSPKEQLLENLFIAVGRPTFLAGITTVASVILLVCLPAYTYRLFFYAVLAVLVLGILYSLLIIPMLFDILLW